MSIRKAAAVPSPVAQYRYSVQWSPEDQEFVATVLEFPSLSWLDEDQFEALRGIERLVSDVIDELINQANRCLSQLQPKGLVADSTFGTPRTSPEASY